MSIRLAAVAAVLTACRDADPAATSTTDLEGLEACLEEAGDDLEACQDDCVDDQKACFERGGADCTDDANACLDDCSDDYDRDADGCSG